MVLLTSPPPNFSPQAEIVTVLPFLAEKKVLLLQRLSSHPQANLWCTPGGKIQQGEIPADAAARELQEETGIAIDPDTLIYIEKFYVQYPNGDFIVHVFKTKIPDCPIQISEREHQAYYFCPLDQLTSLPLTPGLDECFERVTP